MKVSTRDNHLSLEKAQRRLAEIGETIHRERIPIPSFRFFDGDCPGAHRPDFPDGDWREFQVGESWGGYDRTAWFRAVVEVPPRLRGKRLALRFLVGPRDGGGSTAETLLYVNGRPLQAIDIWHEEAWLPPEVLADGRVSVALKAWSGVLDVPERRRFRLAELVRVDPDAAAFHGLASTVLEALGELELHDWRFVKMLGALDAALMLVDWSEPGSDSYYRSLSQALESLRRSVGAWQAMEPEKPTVVGVGHAHIDMAWLWRLRHSREKAARTFATALHLMRQYPEYRFMHSSPQLYRYLEADHPEIFAQVKERVASGEWEITGGMWIESDINLPSGESLIRQILFGRRYIREKFGKESRVLWLPDVFGYSPALPQIMLGSGIPYFMTTKISWSQFNRFPHDTFRWRGIDGSEILAHFITTPEQGSKAFTYNGQLEPKDVKGLWANYQQKDVNDELLQAYGWGDGGGGPTAQMLESARAMCNLPGLPKVQLGHVEPFFERLAERLSDQDLPVWDGELYLEYHRGTYTSQARTKRNNRKAEGLYHEAEWLSSLAGALLGADYPDLTEGWERLLLNQFHDILPGSSIREVYEDSEEDYRFIFAEGERARQAAEETLTAAFGTSGPALVVFNPTPFAASGLVELRADRELERSLVGSPDVVIQRIGGEADSRLLVGVPEVPPLGYAVLPLPDTSGPSVRQAVPPPGAEGPDGPDERQRVAGQGGQQSAAASSATAFSGTASATTAPSATASSAMASSASASSARASSAPVGRRAEGALHVTEREIETPFYRLRLNERGQIASLFDKRAGRQVLAKGARGNVLQAFEDKPLKFDAWDIDLYYGEKMREVDDLLEVRVEECGPLRGVLFQRWRYLSSTVTQRLVVYADDPRIDFVTEIDWRESQTLLKAAFPVDVRTNRATYDIQFGSIERPTHWNTSWDWARFEVVAHRWADLSEGNYGVALLNDCKYGYDARDNVLRLTLLKSPISPDPSADKGDHLFTYSLLPHEGTWREGDVIRQGYLLNRPLRAALVPVPVSSAGDDTGDGESRLPRELSFVRSDAEHVLVETVKRAEDGDGWIVRVYESKQFRSGKVRLTFALPLARALECNLVEEGGEPVPVNGHEMAFPIAPFEIKAFRVWFDDP